MRETRELTGGDARAGGARCHAGARALGAGWTATLSRGPAPGGAEVAVRVVVAGAALSARWREPVERAPHVAVELAVAPGEDRALGRAARLEDARPRLARALGSLPLGGLGPALHASMRALVLRAGWAEACTFHLAGGPAPLARRPRPD